MSVKKEYEKPTLTFVTDLRVMLECLYESYQMEGDLLKSGKNIHVTMIYPFIRMIKAQCSDMEINEEGLHKALWRIYETEDNSATFVDAAWRFLVPDRREAG